MGDKEIWKPVIGYEGYYEVSSHGRVRSVEREVVALCRGKPTSFKYKSRVLKPGFTRNKGNKCYHFVILSRESKTKIFMVHTLVCTTFHGPRPEGKQAAHCDGDKYNNRADNLRWATKEENELDKLAHGRIKKGAEHHFAVLTEDVVKLLRKRFVPHCRKNGSRAMAKELGISAGSVHAAVTGKTWKQVA